MYSGVCVCVCVCIHVHACIHVHVCAHMYCVVSLVSEHISFNKQCIDDIVYFIYGTLIHIIFMMDLIEEV